MKRSDILLWLILFVIAGLMYLLITTGRLHAIANLFVEGYWKFMQNIVHIRVNK